MKSKIHSIQFPMPRSARTRRVRGLFNFVGKLSHSLFGTVDDDTFNDRLSEYNRKLKLVTSTISSTAKSISNMKTNMDTLKMAVLTLLNTTQISTSITSVERFTDISFRIREFDSALTTILRAAHNFARAINLAAHGQVDHDLINVNEFTSILRRLNSLNVTTLFSTDTPMLFYNSLTSFITTKGLSIIVPVKPKSILKSYTTHELPHSFNNTFISLHLPNILLTSGNKLVESHENVLQKCTQISHYKHMCTTPTWSFTTTDNPCLTSVLEYLQCPSNNHSLFDTCKNHTNTKLSQQCTFHETKQYDTQHIIRLDELTIVYYYTPTQIKISCDKPGPWQLVQGPFILPHNCKLESLTLQIPKYNTYTIRFNKHIQFSEPTPFQPFNFTLITPHPNISFLPVDDHTSDFFDVYPTFADYGYHALTSSVITIIILAILFAIMRYVLLSYGYRPIPNRNEQIELNDLANQQAPNPPNLANNPDNLVPS